MATKVDPPLAMKIDGQFTMSLDSLRSAKPIY